MSYNQVVPLRGRSAAEAVSRYIRRESTHPPARPIMGGGAKAYEGLVAPGLAHWYLRHTRSFRGGRGATLRRKIGYFI